MNTAAQSANLPTFWKIQNGSSVITGTLISSAGTGLWETCSFINLNSQFKEELTVCRTFCTEPQPDAFFCIGDSMPEIPFEALCQVLGRDS